MVLALVLLAMILQALTHLQQEDPEDREHHQRFLDVWAGLLLSALASFSKLPFWVLLGKVLTAGLVYLLFTILY